MPTKVNTLGDQRELLMMTALGVKNGQMDVETAMAVVRAVQASNESLYAEIKVARVRKDLAGVEMPELGSLPISSPVRPD